MWFSFRRKNDLPRQDIKPHIIKAKAYIEQKKTDPASAHDKGYITRIHLSNNSRYHFIVDQPPVDTDEYDPDDFTEAQSYEEAMINRAHYHGLFSHRVDEAVITEYVHNHIDELVSSISDMDLSVETEDNFVLAFLAGVKQSKVSDYDINDITTIGAQFCRDFSMYAGEKAPETVRSALLFTETMGLFYMGRVGTWTEDNESGINESAVYSANDNEEDEHG
ncbi:MAG: hypothetical protein MJ142_02725 [Clostridia bacterium]|nr:hypothetical protein [Clostridia bacterium]